MFAVAMDKLSNWLGGGIIVVILLGLAYLPLHQQDVDFAAKQCAAGKAERCPVVEAFDGPSRDKGEFAKAIRAGFASDPELEKWIRGFHADPREDFRPSSKQLSTLLAGTAFLTSDCETVDARDYVCTVQMVKRFTLDIIQGRPWGGEVVPSDWRKVRLHQASGQWELRDEGPTA